jgi:hypothetical protein
MTGMNDSSQRWTTVYTVMLIVASVGGIIYSNRGHLGSPRPPQSGAEPFPTFGSQKMAARLWQDPFETFRHLTNGDARASSPGGRSEAGSDEPGLLPKTLTIHTNPVAILGVMLEGAPYPEDAEVRRRLRYAVEVALLTSDLAPVDRNHIGVDVLPMTNAPAKGFSPTNLNVAFEWFVGTRSTGAAGADALVVWLKEDDFQDRPLDTLNGMLAALGVGAEAKKSFYLIGPRSSDTLRSFAQALRRAGASFAKARPYFKILSPEATAPDSALFEGETSCRDRSWLERELSRKCRPHVLQNWIATDGKLCSLLVSELVNRRVGGPESIQPGSIIALVSEGDTFYGRSLPFAFEQALANYWGSNTTNNVWRFNYLRGLEGIKPLPAEGQNRESKSPATLESLAQEALRTSGEKAEGEAQKDYAQRLADFLHRKDAELRTTNGAIRAVGLTGNDVYDKLLLLQALRPRLPEAIFFTTDLDARLWMLPEQLRYTRNLLVASAYSLEPVAPGQQFLPFRDVYQAAVFAACRGAILQAKGQTNAPAASPRDLHGKLYEIGRHGPVELKLATGAAPPRSLILGRDLRVPTVIYLVALGVVLLYIFLLRGLHPNLPASAGQREVKAKGEPEDDDEPPASEAKRLPAWQAVVYAAVVTTVFLGVMLLAYVISRQAHEEAWTMTDGVAIWPTEAIRLLAVILSVLFLITAARQHGSHCRTLWSSFFSPGGTHSPPNAWELWKSLEKWRKRIGAIRIKSWNVRTTHSPIPNQVDATDLFRGYVVLAWPLSRHVRTWLMALMYFIGAVAFVVLAGGVPDRRCIRGPCSLLFDNVLLLLSIFAFLGVLFYALDAARLAGTMLDCLNRGPTSWPHWLTRKRAREKCVREIDLDGWLDVQFAVEKTKETGRLMLYPFVIFLLLWVARSSFFENWTWPNSLIAVFALNFLLAAACWWCVRSSAANVRQRALSRLHEVAKQIENGREEEIWTPGPLRISQSGQRSETTCIYPKADYAKRLGELGEEIEKERRAAFAPWVQDPTYAALFLPTGIAGILTVVLSAWMKLP